MPPDNGSAILSPRMIREAVKAELAKRDWTLYRLAQETGIRYSRIHDWLGDKGVGERGPSIENLEKIMAALGLRVSGGKRPKPR